MTTVSFSSLQRTAEQSVGIPGTGRRPRGGGGLQSLRPGQDSAAFGGAEHVDTSVPHGRGGRAGWGGLQGFSQAQSSGAFCGAEHADTPVPQGRGQGSSASSSMDRSYVAEGAYDFFIVALFTEWKKVRGPPATAEISRKVIFHPAESSRTPAQGVPRRLKTMARGTSSKTMTRRRKKSSRCSTSASSGSNSLAGDPDASAVTTWQAVVPAGGAARLRMSSNPSSVDVPVLQITESTKGSGEEAGRGKAKVAAVGVAVVLQTQLLGSAGGTILFRNVSAVFPEKSDNFHWT